MIALVLLLVSCAEIRSDVAPWPDASHSGVDLSENSALPDYIVEGIHGPGPGAGQAVPAPIASVDVLVIGSGPAGLSAAWEARAQGASVLILEAAERAGGNGIYAGNLFAVGTPWQVEKGIEDSPELALSEWEDFTGGGDPTDPRVARFVEESASTLSWITESLGASVSEVSPDESTGSVWRVHSMAKGDGNAPTRVLISSLEDDIWLSQPAGALIVRDGIVRGAWLAGEDEQWVEARAVVVATGGYAREVERLTQDDPQLDETGYVFESGPTALGGGHALLEEVGADFHINAHMGVYVHAIADYRPGYEGEALWPTGLSSTLIVDADGRRVASETAIQGFLLYDVLRDTPTRQLYALWPRAVYNDMVVNVPGYNWVDAGTKETIATGEVVSNGGIVVYDNSDALFRDSDFDPTILRATMDRYQSDVSAGVDSEFGKPVGYLVGFGLNPVAVTELVPGTAKNFDGVSTDGAGRVLNSSGRPIYGLFAAGEVTGMLGTAAVGRGLSGSVTACYYTGRVAGQGASSWVAHYKD